MTRKQFTKTLIDWRKRKTLSQSEAAKRLGMSARTMQNWEIARNMPREVGLNALLKAIARR